MKLKTAFTFNCKYPTFDYNSLNNITIANEVYHLFYDTSQNVETKYPNKAQRYTALSRIINQAGKIKSIELVLYDMKLKIDKKSPYHIILEKYLEILIKNNGNIQKSIEEIQEFKPTDNETLNDKLEVQMPQIISQMILKINEYLIKNNFELK